jgi:tetratricopeptide (TPR) repeat protein
MKAKTLKSRSPSRIGLADARSFRGWILGAAVLATLSPLGGAAASTLVIGGGMAKDCSEAVIRGRDDDDTMRLCTAALEVETLSFGDRARTLVNRGVIQLRRQAYVEARADFDAAGRIDPKLGEVYVNRGAALVAEDRFAEGLREIDQGLALGVERPERAYYNRALANENLGDVKAAYYDFQRAAELDPKWTAPKEELARFSFKSR